MHESLGNMEKIKNDHKNMKKSSSTSSQNNSWKSLFLHQKVLCSSIPIWVLVLVASLDNADKQLLASSFSVLEKSLGLGVETLGYFSMFTNLSYALSLPFWGYLVHKYGMAKIHILLSVACVCWGITTCGMALWGGSVTAQAIFRALNGFALGSILPLSQTLLVELVDVPLRGRAFGMMGLCEKLAGTLAAASIVYYESMWRRPYYVLGIFSILMGGISLQALHPSRRRRAMIQRKESNNNKNNKNNKLENDKHDNGDGAAAVQLTLRQIIQRIVQLPAFLCLVAQGIFGGTPWDIMSFLLLLMDWRGFTKEQIVSIQFTSGLSATLGGWLGGMLGDYAHARAGGTKGRIGLALVSVVGGIPLYGLYIYATDYRWALLWSNLFHVWATWAPPGALRPICADLTRNPSERAQIVSLWIVLEKASGAIFGAPLVGYLTSNMLTKEELNTMGVSEGKAQALAFNVFLLSAFFWSICAFFWVAMAVTLPKGRPMTIDGAKNVELNPLV
jgi:MFS family permease